MGRQIDGLVCGGCDKESIVRLCCRPRNPFLSLSLSSRRLLLEAAASFLSSDKPPSPVQYTVHQRTLGAQRDSSFFFFFFWFSSVRYKSNSCCCFCPCARGVILQMLFPFPLMMNRWETKTKGEEGHFFFQNEIASCSFADGVTGLPCDPMGIRLPSCAHVPYARYVVSWTRTVTFNELRKLNISYNDWPVLMQYWTSSSHGASCTPSCFSFICLHTHNLNYLSCELRCFFPSPLSNSSLSFK